MLGLLAAIAAPQVIKHLGGAKAEAAAIQIEKLGGVLDLYRLDVGSYPDESGRSGGTGGATGLDGGSGTAPISRAGSP